MDWSFRDPLTSPVIVSEQLGQIAASPIPVLDVQEIFARFTLDSASEFLFGINLDTLHRELPIPGKAKLWVKASRATEDKFGRFVNGKVSMP